MNKFISILLYPISLVYGLSTYIRNKLYDFGVFNSTEFKLPVISVGNLNVGGVGKTPHVEYLIRLLSTEFNVATLSRGYKRNSKGFYLATSESTIFDIGDEPLQYKTKFDNISVAVDENRVRGIKKIKEIVTETNIVVLDDAYQHRSVKPGINILVTDYSKLYINDLVLPSGRLREWAIGSNRADIIVVSKTPEILSPIDIRRIKSDLDPKPHQEIFFSFTKYGNLIPFTEASNQIDCAKEKNCSVLLVTGIAKPSPLFYHLKNHYSIVEHIKFPDHHNFNSNDLLTIKNSFNDLFGNNKLIITTEKDIMRLSLPEIKNQIEELPIFYQPIEICFHGNDKIEFNEKILKYVRANTKS